jgi:two-component system sensor histidine kinase CpxA
VRSLFTKILLWFFLTVLVTSAASFYISTIFLRSRQPNFNRMSFELKEARTAWETQGRAGLEQFYARYKEATNNVEPVLADASGRDLLTGRDWSKEIHATREFGPRGALPLFPFVRVEPGRRGFVLPTLSRDHKYWFLAVIAPDPAHANWSVEVPRETWWMLALIVILCYVLARHLAEPVRQMQKTVERFGGGDFSVRVNSRRRDELGDLARTVDRMAERIETLVRSQRRLLQDISHELRSPLARLGVAVELARGGGDATTAFNRIEKEADRLNTLVGELIQVTRAEGDPAGLATEALRLDDLVRMIIDDAHIEAERRGIQIRTDIADAEMQGNPELLRRAIENIVRNAIRYSPEHGTVDVRLYRAGSALRVSVRDQGPGVPEESLAHIFDPFYRVEKDRGRTSGGVGLGLAIAKRAVELHHGQMRASNINPGLLVEIDFPGAQQKMQTPQAALEPAIKS